MHLDLSMLHLLKERYTDFSQVEHNNTMAKCISWIDIIEGQHPLKLYYGEGKHSVCEGYTNRNEIFIK